MPKFRSIRWRLIVGFTLLPLLTVSVLGTLVLGLMQRYVTRQERAYLEENAVAIAQQSAHLLDPALSRQAPPSAELISLVQTAALLGNFRVRVLDEAETPIIDSAVPTLGNQLSWLPGGSAEFTPWEITIASDNTQSEMMTGESTAFASIAALEESFVVIHPPALVPEGTGPIRRFLLRTAQGNEVVWQARPALPEVRAQATPLRLRIIRQNQGEWGPLLEFEEAALISDSLVISPTTTVARNGVATNVTTRTPTAVLTETSDIGGSVLAPRIRQRVAVNQVITPIEGSNGAVGYVELSSQSGVAVEALAALRRLFLLVGGGVSLIAVAAGLLFSRGLTAPLAALTDATIRMNEGDLAVRAQIRSSDEIGLLAQAFNQMAAALEKNFAELAAERDALRNFIADASHELRTPITALRTFNDLLQEDTEQDPQVQREFLLESGLQLRRLERITENLLNLSRWDGGLIELQLETVTVAPLYAEVVTLLTPLARERDIVLIVSPIKPTLTVHADRDQIERALVNVVENALKFTLPGGRVELGATAMSESATVTLWVKDSGIGIDPIDQPQLFQRFYRGRTATNGGSGLGLAIVQSIIQAHGGTVQIESAVGVGTLVTMEFGA